MIILVNSQDALSPPRAERAHARPEQFCHLSESEGRLCSVPLCFTNLCAPDPFVQRVSCVHVLRIPLRSIICWTITPTRRIAQIFNERGMTSGRGVLTLAPREPSLRKIAQRIPTRRTREPGFFGEGERYRIRVRQFAISAHPGSLYRRRGERMKSFRSCIPCPCGIATTSYLSKAARMAGTAGSGVGAAPAGLDRWVWAWLIGITAISNRKATQQYFTIRYFTI